ncbi:hypothetical protein RRG08_042072 [Elysia crispata]|uniref:Uncharacterized protein n=1 Tax=Elysia crispata TaxID=231223 RepID=A0AAE0Z5H7_9GAST|nr:hypothetical protein RRG08_042072 [Elysia crispata]
MKSGCRYNEIYRPPSLELQHGPVIESYVELQFSSYFRNGTLLCYSSKLLVYTVFQFLSISASVLTQGFYINRVQSVISNTPGLIFLSTTPVIFVDSSRQHIFVYQTGSSSNPPQSYNVGQSGASPNRADHDDNGNLSTVARSTGVS